jgi:hypothetical protein
VDKFSGFGGLLEGEGRFRRCLEAPASFGQLSERLPEGFRRLRSLQRFPISFRKLSERLPGFQGLGPCPRRLQKVAQVALPVLEHLGASKSPFLSIKVFTSIGSCRRGSETVSRGLVGFREGSRKLPKWLSPSGAWAVSDKAEAFRSRHS